ncbi:MAG: helix-turn-helix domain-containing protein [Halopseudomonas aestusnigri]
MRNSLLAIWVTQAEQNTQALVLPDGCRDLIYKARSGEKPFWFVSDLENESCTVPINKGDYLKGFRLKPGVKISKQNLLSAMEELDPDNDSVLNRLDRYTGLTPSVEEALNCLASGVDSVAQAARLLGVSARTLQRLIQEATGKPPVFWHRLARVRKAGRALNCEGEKATSLAELAFDRGFSDQAHMSREFRTWFGISPSNLRVEVSDDVSSDTTSDISGADQLFALGYA